MLLDLVYVALGLAGLFFGGNWLVLGASRVASSLGVSALVIGLTVVAFGTSTPELLVSVGAALRGEPEIAIGNVVGSNIANIGLILGVSGLITAIPVHVTLIRREMPIALSAAVLLFVLALDGSIGALDGLLLVGGIIAFTSLLIVSARRERVDKQEEQLMAEVEGITGPINRWLELGRLLVGLVVLLVGANLLVEGAVSIARDLQVPEVVIGLTLVAVGTSLPELVTAIIAARRKETEILVGNVVGSNIFNILMILGVTSLVFPVPVSDSVQRVDIPIMIGFSLLLLPFALNRVLSKRESVFILIGYLVYVVAAFTIFQRA